MYVNSVLLITSLFIVLVFNQVRCQNLSQAFDLFTNLTDAVPSLHLINRGKKSYYVGDVFKGNFFHAEQFCRYHGMHLVNIESQEENDFLQEKIVEKGDTTLHFWISGTKLPDHERWISFTTARAITYFNWNKGEPNNSNQKEYCIEMRVNDKELTWNDVECSADFNFICEMTWTQDCQKLYEILKKNEMQFQNITALIDVRSGVVPAE